MATTGAKAPTLGSSVAAAPHNANDWTGQTSIYTQNATSNADTTHCAWITAATFDSPDQSYLLQATGFDFTGIPNGATINGVICQVGAFYTAGQGSGSVDLLQLNDVSRSPAGTNQAASPVALTTTYTTVITFGSSTDVWGNALTTAWVKDPDFGVSLGIAATAANADVFVDFVTLEVYYTANPATSVLYAATVASTSGANAWATASNATGAPDSTYAVYTTSVLGDQPVINLTDFGVQAAIGSPASIIELDVTVTWHDSSNALWADANIQVSNTDPGSTWLPAPRLMTLSTATGNAQTLTYTGTDAPLWADVASLLVQVYFDKAGTTSGSVSVDAVGVVVTYTPGGPDTGWSPPPSPTAYVGTSGLVTAVGAAPGALTPCAETQPGDLLLMHLYSGASNAGGSEAVDLPTGFTWLASAGGDSFNALSPGSGGTLAVARRVCQAGDTSFSWVVHNFQAGDPLLAWLDTWRGQDATDPVWAAQWSTFNVFPAGAERLYWGLTGRLPVYPGDTGVLVAGLGAQYTSAPAPVSVSGANSGLMVQAGLFAGTAGGGGAQVAQWLAARSWSEVTPGVIDSDQQAAITGYSGSAYGLTGFYTVHADPQQVQFRAGFSPVQVNATTGAVTGAWATGQTTAAGSYLVATVAAQATTSAGAISQSNAGTAGTWASLGTQASQGHCQVAYFGKVAAGSDAVPAFASTLAGTRQRMEVTLYELTGVDTAAPVTTTGTATGTTANPLTVTTSGNVTLNGSMGLAIHAAYTGTSATDAWSKAATWTTDTTDGTGAAYAHASMDHFASPPAGAALACGGTWATVPTYEAAMVVVIAPAPAAPVVEPTFPVTAGRMVTSVRENPALFSGN